MLHICAHLDREIGLKEVNFSLLSENVEILSILEILKF